MKDEGCGHVRECLPSLSLHAQVVKSIIGQSIFQLGVMYALVCHADTIFGVPSGSADLMDGPSVHYTLVFNSFVLMQLFNQVILSCAPDLLPCLQVDSHAPAVLPSRCVQR